MACGKIAISDGKVTKGASMSCVRYPSAGCLVEYLEGNSVQIAMILEESSGRLRLLLPNRKEVKLAASRLLPWSGPALSSLPGKDDAARLLEEHKKRREELCAGINVLDVWDLAQGEVESAQADWFAELFSSEPDIDTVAAYGHSLLACKSHFRFQPPEFQVFPAETVEKRLTEQKAKEAREAIVAGGANFLRLLWDVACKKRQLPVPDGPEWPEPDAAGRIFAILRAQMTDPDRQDSDQIWPMLSRGLPDVPHLPLQLLVAAGQLPAHYNFWLDRAGYAPGDSWWQGLVENQDALQDVNSLTERLEQCDLPFVSIDSATTRDIDDAFHVKKLDDGFALTLALACPALGWEFGSKFDLAVRQRGTSIYLPEGTCNMLPEDLANDRFSLLARVPRPALCISLELDRTGKCLDCRPFVARVRLAANLNYHDCQKVLDGFGKGQIDADLQTGDQAENPALPYAEQLAIGLELARSRIDARIAAGAVIMDRPEPVIRLEGDGENTVVSLEQSEPATDANLLVAEMMILASAAIADWAEARQLQLIHRVQDVVVPREYAGVWTKPADMARIMRALIPSGLDVQARPHAALGLARYAPVTSPLRRYTDLVNEAQVMAAIAGGQGIFDATGLENILRSLNPALEAAGQVQRFRPRYWKLLHIRQKGDKAWWPGVITEEGEMFVTVSLPEAGLFVRGLRRQFDDRACPGLPVQVRLGRVNPLYNEIRIIEAVTDDGQEV